MNNAISVQSPARKQGSPLLYFLAMVMALFIGILIFCYIVTKRTHPIFLDEHGKPTNALPASGQSAKSR
jgi:hypothetical protein